MFDLVTDKFLKKNWTDEQIARLVGQYTNTYHCHAKDADVRSEAASGGTGSALLIGLLDLGIIDGALVCRTVVEQGRVRARFFIARSRPEILLARGSKYVETHFIKEALPLVRDFDGHLAVVGLPCDIMNLNRWMQKDEGLAEKVLLKIALVCGHNSRVELIDQITKQLEKTNNSTLVDYCFRKGHWRGNLEAGFANGRKIEKPFSYFSLYQNLFFFSERKCLVCCDHFGYDADISLGDVWAYRFKNDPIKKTGVIIRTETGDRYWNRAIASEGIVVEPLSIKDILDGQARAAPYHYNVSARHRIAPLVGYKVPDKVKQPVTWHEWLAALMAMVNMRWSENHRWKPLIFKLPRSFLKIYLYVRKGLESLQ